MKNKVFGKVCVGLVTSIIIMGLSLTVSGKATDYRYEKYDYEEDECKGIPYYEYGYLGSYYKDYDYEEYGYLGYFYKYFYSYAYEFFKYLYEHFPIFEYYVNNFFQLDFDIESPMTD